MQTERIKVQGMSCQHCVARVREALLEQAGVGIESVEIGEVVVSLEPGEGARDTALAAIRLAGYTAD